MEGYPGIDPNTLLASMSNQKNGYGENNIFFLVLLFLFYGRGGLGGFGNEAAAAAGAGIRSNATQNDVAQQTQFLQQQIAAGNAALGQQHGNIKDRISDLNSSNDVHALTNMAAIKDVQAVLQAATCNTDMLVQQGNAQLSREICECCCKLGIEIKDTQRAVEVGNLSVMNQVDKGNAAILNAICNQTNELTAISTAQTQRIVDLINAQAQKELESKLHDCQDALNNQRQTNELAELIRRRCHPWHHPFIPQDGGNGNGGGIG